MLDLHGCIVTIDAMGCQREIAQQITDGGADYVLAVKENQGQLYAGIQDLLEGVAALGFDGVPYDYAQTLNKGHGRVERRECWVITDPDCLNYVDPQGLWPQLKAVVRVAGHRQTAEAVPVNSATTSAAWPAQRSSSRPRSEATGASKTRCTGSWT